MNIKKSCKIFIVAVILLMTIGCSFFNFLLIGEKKTVKADASNASSSQGSILDNDALPSSNVA